MPRQEGQKAKLLVLKSILERKTDENHPLSVPRLVQALQNEGIQAERKSVYNDIEALRESGVDVELIRGRSGGYYLASRTFELAELKLLVDAVQSSQFITRAKSEKLIKKLENFASEYQAKQMQRQVFVSGRVKTMNESIYYNVDALHAAIADNRQVTFQYLEWNLNKRKVARKNGELYQVSPWALAWENDNYYLIACTGAETKPRHYRVDKMRKVTAVDEPRQGREAFRALDLADYTRKRFGMYNGEEARVTLKCKNSLVGVMLDRFGTEAILVPQPDDTFHLTVSVAVSPQFLGWVCGFEGNVKVISPGNVQAQMARLAAALVGNYGLPEE